MGEHDTFITVQEPTQGTVVIVPHSDVDMSRSPDLRTAIHQAIKPGTKKLIVDLEQVGYMDSSGLATLVEAMRLTKAADTDLILSAMHTKVRAIFEIAKLDAFFSIVDSVDAALQP